jgi:lysophospholipase L1-like esterase
MPKRSLRCLGLLVAALVPVAACFGREPFALADGDRVVFLGNGVIEQEQACGELETRLTRRWPQARVIFRNMGWSGDTVGCQARTIGYEQPAGLAGVLKEFKALKPTVIFVGYGLNESFAGQPGLSNFELVYRRFLDQLEPFQAKLVLLSPPWHEDLGRPFPDPTVHNQDIEKYAAAISRIAGERQAAYLDVFTPLRDAKARRPTPLTTNGIQLNPQGYAVLATAIEDGLGVAPPPWEMQLGDQGVKATGFAVKEQVSAAGGWKVVVVDDVVRVPGEPLRFIWAGARGGDYEIACDGQIAATVPAAKLAAGVVLEGPVVCPEGEKLRRAIVEKGAIFYRRWRPFNDHDRHYRFIRGDYALYDEEIAVLEQTIAGLRTPRERTIEVRPVTGNAR